MASINEETFQPHDRHDYHGDLRHRVDRRIHGLRPDPEDKIRSGTVLLVI